MSRENPTVFAKTTGKIILSLDIQKQIQSTDGFVKMEASFGMAGKRWLFK
jgi:hypothetical protein